MSRRRWCPRMVISSRGSVRGLPLRGRRHPCLPLEEGKHRCPRSALPRTESILFVFFARPESPLQFYVNYPNSGSVSAYGPGLVYGVANKTATFTIVTEDAGEGTVTCVWLYAFRFPFENPVDTTPGQLLKRRLLGSSIYLFLFHVNLRHSCSVFHPKQDFLKFLGF